MAQPNTVNKSPVLSGSKILVTVLQALPDILLVAVEYEDKNFQGVLLDSSKGHLPCGIYPPGGCYPPPPDLSNNKLYSVKQRHSYFCADSDVNVGAVSGAPLSYGQAKSKPVGRPSVRLRPRHVLCSNCRQVCNEKNERVRDNKAPPPEGSVKPLCANVLKSGHNAAAAKKSDKSSSQSATGASPQTSKTRSGLSIRNSNKQSLNSKNKTSAKTSESAVNAGVSGDKVLNKITPCKSKEAKPAGTRATRRTVQQNKGSSNNGGKRQLDHLGCDSVLIPKLKKLKPSEIESANCNASALCSEESNSKSNSSRKRDDKSNIQLSESHSQIPANRALNLVANSSQNSQVKDLPGQIPKLRFSSVNNRIAKVTLSTSGKLSQSSKKRASKAPQSCRPTIPKMVLSKTASSSLNTSSSSDTVSSMLEPTVMSCANTSVKVTSTGPKVTILPLASKASNNPSIKETEVQPKEEEKTIPLVDKEAFDTNSIKHPAPLLKICIAPDGTGTIMKIPPKPEVTAPSSSTEGSDVTNNKQSDFTTKAARKALKRAKKEAQRKLLMSRGSPSYSLIGGVSPRYGGMSPLRLGGLSPGRSCWPSDRLGSKKSSKLSLSSPGRIGGSSPVRWNGTSPARLNCFSPSSRNEEKPPASGPIWEQSSKENACDAQLASGGTSKKHKHKMKHKKKHKGDRKAKDMHVTPCSIESEKSLCSGTAGVPVLMESFDTKEHNELEDASRSNSPKQKLSLSIKRVKSDGCEYVTRDCSSEESSSSFSSRGLDEKTYLQIKSVTGISGIVKKLSKRRSSGESLSSNPSKGGVDGDSSDDQCDVPAFPPSMASVISPPVDSCQWQDIECCHVRAPVKPGDASLADGNSLVCRLSRPALEEGWLNMAVGDVVWAKILGFPWWPAMVTHLRVRDAVCVQNTGKRTECTPASEHSVDYRKDFAAQVSWYGSATTSTLHPASLRPFILCFKQRYSKKKRGPYRSAVKEALRVAEAQLAPNLPLDLSLGGGRGPSLLSCSNSSATVPPPHSSTIPSSACDNLAVVVKQQGSAVQTQASNRTLLSSACHSLVSTSSNITSCLTSSFPLNVIQSDYSGQSAKLMVPDSSLETSFDASLPERSGNNFPVASADVPDERDAVAEEKTASVADTIDVSHLLKEANFSAYPKFTTSRISKTSPGTSETVDYSVSKPADAASQTGRADVHVQQSPALGIVELESTMVANPSEQEPQINVYVRENVQSVEDTVSSATTFQRQVSRRGPALRVPTYPITATVPVSPCSSPSSGVGMSGNGSPSSPHTVDVYS
ncbi:PWWP domain [Trinorchestia longiramus]|nr:PWWP domain [Trinorchestia longiramus]